MGGHLHEIDYKRDHGPTLAGCTVPSLELDIEVPDVVLPASDVEEELDADTVQQEEDGTDTTPDSANLPDAVPPDSWTPDIADPDVIPPDVFEPDAADTEDSGPDTVEPPPDCGDNDKCTIDLYNKELGECEYYPVGCNDGLACTIDMCDPEEGCVFPLDTNQPGCCTEDDDCDDDDGCTWDACEDNECVYVLDPNPACCVTNEDCDDGDSCTEDICAETGCTNTPIGAPTCCDVHSDCDDGDSCTWDQCSTSGCTYTDLCCGSSADCPDLDSSCFEVDCLEGWCVQLPVEQSPEEGAECCQPGSLLDLTVHTPNTSHTTETHSWTFIQKDDDVIWEYKSDEEWSLFSSVPHSASFSIAGVELPEGVQSTFTLELLPMIQMDLGVDRLAISIEEDGKSHPVWGKHLLSTSGWDTVTLDLSAWAGRTISVLIAYDSVTNDTSGIDSISIRNPALITACSLLSCSEAECDDGIATTAETCIEGSCAFSLAPGTCNPVTAGADCGESTICTDRTCESLFCTETVTPGCCEKDEDCNDGDDCTKDSCGWIEENVCTFQSIPFCCTQDSDCQDKNPCTDNFCHPTDGCLSTQSDSCCESDEECNDGDGCTDDRCQSGACTHNNVCCVSDSECTYPDNACLSGMCESGQCVEEVVPDENCCTVPLFSQSWASLADLSNWAIIADSDPDDDVHWQLQTQFTQSSPFALYYGNSSTWTYDTGTQGNSGAIESPLFISNPGKPLWVHFDVYLANEFSSGGMPNADFDRLDVFVVLDEAEEKILWSSTDQSPTWWITDENTLPAGAKWTSIGPLILPPNPSGKWNLRFRFDTIDGSANFHAGVAIGDISVHTECE